MAPMAGITDPPFRKLVRRYGAAMAASEMTTSDQSLWRTRKSRHRLALDDEARPRVVQIAGSEPAAMADAARALADMGAEIVDINMGCPAKKVCRALAGSALLRDEELVAKILHAVSGAVSIPVTLKTRTGWDPEHRNLQRVAQLAADAGIAALAVHGRTRACRYRGKAEFDTIAGIRDVFPGPLFANGDIASAPQALAVKKVTRADGVMIGRAAMGQPWIFRDLIGYQRNGCYPAPLSVSEVRDMILGHLDDMHSFYGEESGVRVARKHLSGYCEHFKDSEQFRYAVLRADNAKLQTHLTNTFLRTAEFTTNEGGIAAVA